VNQSRAATARSRAGRLYWRVAERLPDGWRPHFAAFATRLAHGRRAERRLRRRLWRVVYRRLQRSARRRTGLAVVQWIARRYPPVRLPGTGPVWLVDARGVPAAQVANVVVAHRQRPDAPRLVALVDDPRVDALRSAGIVYEYVPDTMDSAALIDRCGLLTWSYGVQRAMLFTEL
jgi:hypothetical protein